MLNYNDLASFIIAPLASALAGSAGVALRRLREAKAGQHPPDSVGIVLVAVIGGLVLGAVIGGLTNQLTYSIVDSKRRLNDLIYLGLPLLGVLASACVAFLAGVAIS